MSSYCIEIDKTPYLRHARNKTQTACSRLTVWHKYIVHVQLIGARPTPACLQVAGGRLPVVGGGFKMGQPSNFLFGRWIPLALRVPIQDTKTKTEKKCVFTLHI